MTDPTARTSTEDRVRTTHSVAGSLWGLLLGVGLAVGAVDQRMIDLAPVPVVLLVLVGVLAGVAWARFGPARRPEAPQQPPTGG